MTSLNEILTFFRYEFFPGMLSFISSFLNNTFGIELTQTQLVIIGMVIIIILVSMLIDVIKKIIPLLIILFILLYLFYGDLSFIENIFNTVPLQ